MTKSVNWPRLLVLVFALRMSQPLCVRAQENANPSPPAAAAISAIRYPDSPGGLEHLGKDLLTALKNNDSARAMTLAQSMALPDAAAWYHQTYGDFSGKEDVRAYEHDRPQLAFKLLSLFNQAIAAGTTGIHVKRYDHGCDDNDGENTFPLLEYRMRETPLYDLRLFNGERYFRLWPIAYVDGSFRYLGEPEPWNYFPPGAGAPAPSASSSKSPAQDKEDREVAQIMQGGAQASQIRVGGTYAAAKIIKQVKPVYPDRARGEHVQGVVQMHAIIGKDGSIANLRVTKGYCSLAPAALTAVRQWRYSPTLFQGKPVEVDTTLEVVFHLNER
jgi:TonB family protein